MSETATQSTLRVTSSRGTKPRLAYVGVGWIGWNRMKAVADSGLADVCAILEPRPDMARRAHELAPDAEIVERLEDVFADRPDGIVIATPSALHAEQTIAALERGVAVFCQKPLGISRQDTARALRAARVADRLLHVDLCYRFLTGAVKIRELIKAGTLGEVFALDLTFHNSYGPDKSWFYECTLSGGGCLIDLGIHLVDLALWLLGFPKVEMVSGRLFKDGRKFAGRKIEVEDFAEADLVLETGAAVHFSCSWKAHAGRDAVIEASVYGTRGGAKLSNVDGSFYDFKAEHYNGPVSRIIALPPEPWQERAALAWLAALRVRNQFDPAIQNLEAAADILDRIYDA